MHCQKEFEKLTINFMWLENRYLPPKPVPVFDSESSFPPNKPGSKLNRMESPPLPVVTGYDASVAGSVFLNS
jgi:hypothetical protein